MNWSRFLPLFEAETSLQSPPAGSKAEALLASLTSERVESMDDAEVWDLLDELRRAAGEFLLFDYAQRAAPPPGQRPEVTSSEKQMTQNHVPEAETPEGRHAWLARLIASRRKSDRAA